ncbi:pentatricopeptide repeat protein [Bradyrhizobium japonicum]|nr:pentatricopeptide repeat protein [Bradyrhizobium japonicum]MCW2344863.1 pentatricopeptide repeat protein [Bradyrhizobium japonicum]
MHVLVRNNNVEQALHVLKKKMQREGVFREMKQRRSYDNLEVGGHSPGPQARAQAGDPRGIAARAAEKEAVRAQAALAGGQGTSGIEDAVTEHVAMR